MPLRKLIKLDASYVCNVVCTVRQCAWMNVSCIKAKVCFSVLQILVVRTVQIHWGPVLYDRCCRFFPYMVWFVRNSLGWAGGETAPAAAAAVYLDDLHHSVPQHLGKYRVGSPSDALTVFSPHIHPWRPSQHSLGPINEGHPFHPPPTYHNL